jgi:hypothetical protein
VRRDLNTRDRPSDGRIAAAAAVTGKPGVYYAGARRAECGSPPTAAPRGSRRSTRRRRRRSARSRCRRANPNIVWAGTGEGWAVRDMDMMGDGVYKSIDAG